MMEQKRIVLLVYVFLLTLGLLDPEIVEASGVRLGFEGPIEKLIEWGTSTFSDDYYVFCFRRSDYSDELYGYEPLQSCDSQRSSNRSRVNLFRSNFE